MCIVRALGDYSSIVTLAKRVESRERASAARESSQIERHLSPRVERKRLRYFFFIYFCRSSSCLFIFCQSEQKKKYTRYIKKKQYQTRLFFCFYCRLIIMCHLTTHRERRRREYCICCAGKKCAVTGTILWHARSRTVRRAVINPPGGLGDSVAGKRANVWHLSRAFALAV